MRLLNAFLFGVLVTGLSLQAAPTEQLPEGFKVVGMEVSPSSVELGDRFAYAQVLVTGILDNGDRVDLTRLAKREAPSNIDVSESGLVRTRADGKGTLRFSYEGHQARVSVAVSGHADPYQISYVQDVMPIMTKVGCTSGTCHGSLNGKNGFKLSIRGNDPLFDHRALTDDLKGRRFNKASPDKSLFLMKLSGKVPHEGGVLAKPGEPYYEILRGWVTDGVQLDLESPRVKKVEIFPQGHVVPLAGISQQMRVVATYADGRVRDVTAEAFVESSNTEVLSADPKTSVVTALRRGESGVLARFEGAYTATQMYVMGDRSGFTWNDPPVNNHVDSYVYEKLKKIKALPSGLSSDDEFLRRVYLDLTGLLPRPQEVRNFIADTRDTQVKRNEVIDRLIGGPAFIEHWTNKWSDLLQVNSKFLGAEGALALRDWIRSQLASNRAYDQFVYEVLTASGSTIENPPAAYFKVLRDPDLVMENTTQLFLGIRFNCNKCHDHPFERWTQSNHWELAAYFAQVGRKNAAGSTKMPSSSTNKNPPFFEEIIFDKNEGEVSYSGREVPPSFPYEHPGNRTSSKEHRREQLARWLTARENPYFAKSFVNRIWSYFLGVGLIDPVDDIRAGNPPSVPALLERLTTDFLASDFNVRELMRTICRSRIYQHSVKTNRWNEDDKINFSHALARRLGAETIYDAIQQATGSERKFEGQRRGTRAAELPDPSVKLPDGFLDLFGRPARESACECERSSNMSLGQALSLVNGPTVAEAIDDPNNGIADLISVQSDSRKIVDELYLSTLSRFPTAAEFAKVEEVFDVGRLENTSYLTKEVAEFVTKRQAEWEKKQAVIDWQALDFQLLRSEKGAKFELQDDGSLLVSYPGDVPDIDTYTLVSPTDLDGITGFQLDVIPDERLPGKGSGLGEDGNFVLSEFRVSLSETEKDRDVILESPMATISPRAFEIVRATDRRRDADSKGWSVQPEAQTMHRATFQVREAKHPENANEEQKRKSRAFGGPGSLLVFRFVHNYGSKSLVGRFRIRVTTSERPIRLPGYSAAVEAALRKPADERTPEERATIFAYFITTDREAADKIRLSSAQDLAWALINNPAFLFNR